MSCAYQLFPEFSRNATSRIRILPEDFCFQPRGGRGRAGPAPRANGKVTEMLKVCRKRQNYGSVQDLERENLAEREASGGERHKARGARGCGDSQLLGSQTPREAWHGGQAAAQPASLRALMFFVHVGFSLLQPLSFSFYVSLKICLNFSLIAWQSLRVIIFY